mmetsp:Transcript_24232/g.43088  ORF Transcript_24232/g.43088 Transcript_24232/m.43088 type:complete len:107 (-) Transcript_24232:766-1086(-)
MEEDYYDISPEDDAELTKLGIPYEFRDSCMPLMRTYLQCRGAHYWPFSLIQCRSERIEWETCQQLREETIIKTVNLKPVKRGIRLEQKASDNKAADTESSGQKVVA